MSFLGKHISSLPTPAFIIDREVVEANCRQMLETAAESGVKLRGQTKTHKTVEGGVLQTGGTRRCIVTSTLVEVSPDLWPGMPVSWLCIFSARCTPMPGLMTFCTASPSSPLTLRESTG